MVTYLVGTDGVSASEILCEFLGNRLEPEDHIEVVHVIPSDSSDDVKAGREALETFEEQLGETVSMETRQVARGRKPADELVDQAEEVDADHMVTALRRHSRTERIIFGSVSHSLLQKVTLPITLVPIEEYQPPAE